MLLLAAVFLPFVLALTAPLPDPAAGRTRGLCPWRSPFAPGLALAALVPAARSGTPTAAERYLGLGNRPFAQFPRRRVFTAICASGRRHGRAGDDLRVVVSGGHVNGTDVFTATCCSSAGRCWGFVLSDNLVALFAFWELTSIASFLLIGFWDDRRAAQDGGDQGARDYGGGRTGAAGVGRAAESRRGAASICRSSTLTRFARAPPSFRRSRCCSSPPLTKSAQFPFHLWLPTRDGGPDADLGVSALGDDGQGRDRAARQICAALRDERVVGRSAPISAW